MAFDVLHEGHIRLLETAKEHGHVVVGLLTDAAISSVKRFSPAGVTTKDYRPTAPARRFSRDAGYLRLCPEPRVVKARCRRTQR